MSHLCVRIAKVAPLVLKRSTSNTIDMLSKPLSSGALNNTFPRSIVFAPLVQDGSSFLWDHGNVNLYVIRSCSTNTSEPVPSPPNRSPTPSNNNIPSKEQVEKAFFRIVAFCWDNGGSLIGWSRDMFKIFVLDAPSVQFYWKRFHEKMEEAKKSDN